MITSPMPFEEAIRFLLDKEDLPGEWDAADWTEQEPDFRAKAFFSANVESARFLDRAHGFIFDFMAKTTEEVVGPDGVKRTALKIAGREHFVKRMRDFMISEGMADPGEFVNVNQKDVTDIRSVSRLRLIFDTNVRQAYGFGQWKQGMKPAVLYAFPAARLIRDRGVKEPRPRHQNNLGEILLKTDPRWAEFHNDPAIGGFGVPWGPYGFNSGVTQEDVSRAVAEREGLDVESVRPQSSSLTNGTEASVKKMNPEIKRKMLEELRSKRAELSVQPTPQERAREAAAGVRREMLQRGLDKAAERGDEKKTIRYREAIADLPSRTIAIVDRGDSIRAFTDAESVISALKDSSISTDEALKALVDLGMSEADAKDALGILR